MKQLLLFFSFKKNGIEWVGGRKCYLLSAKYILSTRHKLAVSTFYLIYLFIFFLKRNSFVLLLFVFFFLMTNFRETQHSKEKEELLLSKL